MPDTLTALFWDRVETSPDLDAELVKRDGRWQALAWRDVGTIVRELALGLLALGRRPGDAVAILAASRAEWVHADFAILSTQGVTIPIYATYAPEQIAYILDNAAARTVIVENAAQLAAVRAAPMKLTSLDTIIVIEGVPRREPGVLSWDDVRQLGRRHAARLESTLADRVASIRPDDIATIVYTSGTTGFPKGVVQTHANHMAMLRAVAQVPGVEIGDVHLLFLPLAHTFARLEAYMGVHRGLVTAFAESLQTVSANLREVRPHLIFAVPRVFEKAHAQVLAAVEQRPLVARKVFEWAMRIGREVSRRQQEGRPVSRRLTVAHGLAHRAVFKALHGRFGGRLRFAVSGGAPLSREIAEFFHAAGILILEGYGLTEACPSLTFNRIDRYKFGSVGQALPDVELKVAADGEILARGPNVATRGYWCQPDATAETFDRDGWLHTGDIGRLDEEGFLYITDRKKDLIITSGGANVAPQPIEDALKRDPLVSQAMLHGDCRPYLVALVTLRPEAVKSFARAQGMLTDDLSRLSQHPGVRDRVDRIVQIVNRGLASYAQIKRFAVLPEEFTEEGGELTPTQKLKRQKVAAKYAAELAALYERSAPLPAAAATRRH